MDAVEYSMPLKACQQYVFITAFNLIADAHKIDTDRDWISQISVSLFNMG